MDDIRGISERSRRGKNNGSLLNDEGKIPLLDRITYGPIKKFTKYNRFPWKMLIHIVLVFVVTAQIVLTIDATGGYSEFAEILLYKTFFDDAGDYNEVDFDKKRYFYSVGEVQEFINTTVHAYYELPTSDSFDTFVIPTVQRIGGKAPIKATLDVFYLKDHDRKSHFKNITFPLSKRHLGPFDDTDENVRNFISNTTHFQISYKIDNYVPSETKVAESDCYHWTISQVFDFTRRNVIEMNVKMNRNY